MVNQCPFVVWRIENVVANGCSVLDVTLPSGT